MYEGSGVGTRRSRSGTRRRLLRTSCVLHGVRRQEFPINTLRVTAVVFEYNTYDTAVSAIFFVWQAGILPLDHGCVLRTRVLRRASDEHYTR